MKIRLKETPTEAPHCVEVLKSYGFTEGTLYEAEAVTISGYTYFRATSDYGKVDGWSAGYFEVVEEEGKANAAR